MPEVTVESQAIEQIKLLEKNLADNYIPKASYIKIQDQLVALEKSLKDFGRKSQPDPVFGTVEMAEEAAQFLVETSLRPAVARKQSLIGGMSKSIKNLLEKTPQDLSNWVNSAGGYTVQTSVYPILEQLFLQSGLARRHCNWTQIMGKLQIASATDQACATFQGAIATTAPTDIATISQTTLPLSPVTLAPAPLNSIYYMGRQLLFNTATNLAARVMENLAKANTLAEDITVIWGDGSTTFGDNYGFTNVSGVVKNTTNAAGKLLIPLNTTPGASNALPTLDDLITLTTTVQEEAALEDDCAYFMHRQVAAYFRSLKASTSGLYFLDPVVNPINTPLGRPAFTFMGHPVYTWQRMSTGQQTTGAVALTVDGAGAPHWSTTAMALGNVYPIVAFGSLKRAALLATNRDFAIESSLEYRFAQDEISYKGREDFGTSWPLPQALACIGLTDHNS